jgi:hypothetical protein
LWGEVSDTRDSLDWPWDQKLIDELRALLRCFPRRQQIRRGESRSLARLASLGIASAALPGHTKAIDQQGEDPPPWGAHGGPERGALGLNKS